MTVQIQVVQLTLPLFIGTIVNWLLFGVLLVQVYIYYAAFPHDPRWAKLGVAAVILLEILETVADLREMVNTFGLRWGDLEALDEIGMSWFAVPVLGPVIASIGQFVFGWRIHLIGQTIYLPILICFTSVVQLGAGVWTGVNIAKAGRFSLLQNTNVPATSLWLASTSLCDVLILAGMVYYLSKARQREFTRMNSAISRILFLTVETGALCTIVVLVDLYLFLAFKGTNLHLSLCIELSKIYSNSILLIFNSRATISYRVIQPEDVNISVAVDKTVTSIRFARPSLATASGTTSATDHGELDSSQSHDETKKIHDTIV
ncbi:hypothetical protein MIND_00998500 [Mycena indigotica]|uniref:DUF6534 domain-containing protein n=1 Tax=Mycena indigotica TaxID=2126181 RepID=A0A8H6S851_9AGAR|nr:uncharacterized protein MIND_00998500 [Mycena indigotica]KAF7294619.1 hypothetical protein MIND_00998500 [Mycena indigotica]